MKRGPNRTNMVVAKVLRECPHPLSLQEIYGAVCKTLPSVAFSSVFRVVRKMEAEGQILRADWRERGGRFEWAGRGHHHHIVCTNCGREADVLADCFLIDEQKIAAATGFTLSEHMLELQGLCHDCALLSTSGGSARFVKIITDGQV